MLNRVIKSWDVIGEAVPRNTPVGVPFISDENKCREYRNKRPGFSLIDSRQGIELPSLVMSPGYMYVFDGEWITDPDIVPIPSSDGSVRSWARLAIDDHDYDGSIGISALANPISIFGTSANAQEPEHTTQTLVASMLCSANKGTSGYTQAPATFTGRISQIEVPTSMASLISVDTTKIHKGVQRCFVRREFRAEMTGTYSAVLFPPSMNNFGYPTSLSRVLKCIDNGDWEFQQSDLARVYSGAVISILPISFHWQSDTSYPYKIEDLMGIDNADAYGTPIFDNGAVGNFYDALMLLPPQDAKDPGMAPDSSIWPNQYVGSMNGTIPFTPFARAASFSFSNRELPNSANSLEYVATSLGCDAGYKQQDVASKRVYPNPPSDKLNFSLRDTRANPYVGCRACVQAGEFIAKAWPDYYRNSWLVYSLHAR